MLQACAAALVAAYYLIPSFRHSADQLQVIKLHGGLLFSALTTAFGGAFLPELARRVTLGASTPLGRLLFQLAFFAGLGISVDLLYREMAVLFGAEASIEVVLKKILIDQFVYAPCFSVLFSTLLFSWESQGFSVEKTKEALANGGFARHYFPLLITCWCFWGPVLGAVYALPVNLQFMLYLCANAAWSLLLLHISTSP
ncbi:MAG TPA: hypothetical protein VG944_20195 [Fimbriimonas sp.]|nr:hypothetical protein [Fimbriimonas sp.]